MKNMRKALMTAALSCAMFGTAFADGLDTRFGQYNITVNDFIIMQPNGQWPHQVDPQATFLDENGNPIATNPEDFTVTANRSWKVRIYATTFDRSPASPNPLLIGDHIDPALIYQVESSNGEAPVTTNGANVWTPIPLQVPSGGAIVASSPQGTFQKKFTLRGRIVPNLALNMSGNYSSTVTIVAALD